MPRFLPIRANPRLESDWKYNKKEAVSADNYFKLPMVKFPGLVHADGAE